MENIIETPGMQARREIRAVVEQEISRIEWMLRIHNEIRTVAGRERVWSEELLHARVDELRALLRFLDGRERWQRNTEEEQELREQMRRRSA